MVAGKQYEVYVHKGKPIWKIITGILFSHAGLFCVCMGYGLLGIFSFLATQCENLGIFLVFYVKSRIALLWKLLIY